jgi:hypothetical protein
MRAETRTNEQNVVKRGISEDIRQLMPWRTQNHTKMSSARDVL